MRCRHWESDPIQVTASRAPRTIHDFRGFGAELERTTYPVPGDPDLAAAIVDRLIQRGLPARLDPDRGLDHGAWIPMALMRPDADIPVIQVSLPREFAAVQRLGEVLSPLAEQDIQLIGSGAITHSLRDSLTANEDADPADFAKRFLTALEPSLAEGDPAALVNWQSHPDATRNHPTPEHFLPLVFAMAAGAEQANGKGERLHHSWSRSALAMDIWSFG